MKPVIYLHHRVKLVKEPSRHRRDGHRDGHGHSSHDEESKRGDDGKWSFYFLSWITIVYVYV